MTSMLWECRNSCQRYIGIGMLQPAKVCAQAKQEAASLSLQRKAVCSLSFKHQKLWPMCCNRAEMLLHGLSIGSKTLFRKAGKLENGTFNDR